MKAIQCFKIGDPSTSLHIKNTISIPQITNQDQILVKVYYAAINPCDWKHVLGFYTWLHDKTPFTPGIDFSGRVIAKGTNVKHVEIGDIIYGQTWISSCGSMAQFTLVESSNCAKIPYNTTPLEAAAIPLISITSYQALTKAQLRKGQKLLIFGGSTACGLAAIQLAKNYFNCDDITVTSTSEKLCKSLGADVVINYKQIQYEKILKDKCFDVVLDCVGGKQYWEQCLDKNIIKKSGYYVSIVGDNENGLDPSSELVNESNGMGNTWVSKVSIERNRLAQSGNGPIYNLHSENPSQSIDDVTKLVELGKLKPILDSGSPYKFEEFIEMFERSVSKRAKGKLVLEICPQTNRINSKL
eukprot:215845_1